MPAQTLEALRDQLESARQLHQVTKTMRSLAAVNIRQYEESVEAVAEYFETIEWGLHIALQGRATLTTMTDEPAGKTLGAVVFGSDQGLVGQFNNRIATFALEHMEELGIEPRDRSVLVVGHLATATFEQLGQPVETQLSVPSSLSGIVRKVQDILFHLDSWRTEKGVDQIVLFHNTPESGSTYTSTMRQMLPVSAQWLEMLKQREWDSHTLPIYRMDWQALFRALMQQYFFVLLYRALAESLASENASRLSSMQAAEQNIRDRINALQRDYHHLRQSSITEEILDIASGFEALQEDR